MIRSYIPASEMFLLGCASSSEAMIVGNILDSMSDCLIVLGEDGEVLFANKITESVLGYSLKDFREKGLEELFFGSKGNADFKQVFLDALRNRTVKNYREVDYQHPDGTVRHLAATTSYLLASGETESTFIGFVALFKDITEVFELRRMEEALVREKERIAKEKIISLHKLAMGVAHEVRNPLVTMGGFAARIARDHSNSERTRLSAQNIVEDARKLETMVNEIQQYCDLPEANPTLGNLAGTVAAAIQDAASYAADRRIAIRLEDQLGAGSLVPFDSALIKMAVTRMLKNSVDFSQEDSAVDVSVRSEDSDAVIEVRDTGAGISEDDRKYIFNPFFSTQVHGTGMGLAVVEKVTQEHGGRIELESAPGTGTTMRLIIPKTGILTRGN